MLKLPTEIDPIIITIRSGKVEILENKAIIVDGTKFLSQEQAEITEARHKADGNGKPKRVVPRQGRNEKCACGSKKKFKHCCMD